MKYKASMFLIALMLIFSFSAYADALNENFDGTWSGDPAAPEGWKVINNNDDSYEWSRSSQYISPHSGSWTAHGMGNSDDYLITPQLSVSSGDQLVWWDVVEDSAKRNSYKVLISTTDDQISSFSTELGTYDCTNEAWVQHTIDLSAYDGQNVYIAFYQNYSASTYYGFGIDDVTGPDIYVPPTPPSPATLDAPDDGATEVSNFPVLSWASGGGFPSGYKLSLGTNNPPSNILRNEDLGDVTTYNASLGYSQTYYWQVVPYNQYGDAASCPVWSFTTMDDPTITTFPHTEDFEGDWLPAGWTIINNNGDGDYWKQNTSSTYSHSGSKSATIYTDYNSANDDYLVTPPINATGGRVLKFWTRARSSGEPEELQVLVSTSSPTPENFTEVIMPSTPINFTTYTEYEFALIGYTGNIYVAFVRNQDPADGYYLYIDDVTLDEAVAYDMDIRDVSDLIVAAGESGTYEVEIENKGASNDTYNLSLTGGAWTYTMYEHGTTNTISSIAINSGQTGIVDIKVDVPAVGVSSGDTDQIQFSAVSVGDGSVSDSEDITTTTVIPLLSINEGFEGISAAGELPADWTVSGNSSKFKTATSTGTYNRGPHTGTNYAWFMYGCDNWLFTPMINFNSESLYNFSLWHKNDGGSGWETLEVKYGTQPNSAAMTNTIASVSDVTNQEYTELSGTISTGSGGLYYIGIHCDATSSPWYLCIDDISCVEVLPYMVNVQDVPGETVLAGNSFTYEVNIQNVGTQNDTYDLAINPAQRMWLYEIYEHGTTNVISSIAVNTGETGVVDVLVTVPSGVENEEQDIATFTATSQNDGQMSSSADITTTALAPVNTISENFENVTAPEMPFGWTVIEDVMSSSAYVKTNNSSSYAHSGTNSLKFYNYNEVFSGLYAITPPFNIGVGGNMVTFWAKGDTDYTIDVGTISDPTDEATFELVESVTISGTYTEYNVAIPNIVRESKYVAFRHGGGGTYRSIYIDDVNIERILEYGVRLTALDQDGITLAGRTISYEVELRHVGFGQNGGTYILSTNGNEWPVTFKDENGSGISQVTVASGEAASFWVEVQVPATAAPEADDIVEVIATSAVDPEANNSVMYVTTTDHFVMLTSDDDDPYAPVYNWIEIDPARGGNGTNIDFPNYDSWPKDDASTGLVDMEMAINFFGNDFDQISMCVNGWASFTDEAYNIRSSWGTSYYNFLAILSKDITMYKNGAATEGYCYKYLNDTKDVLIIQYSNIFPYGDPSQTCTMQIILDKKFNTITYQYYEMNNGFNPGSAIVGIQNSDGTKRYSYDNSGDNLLHPDLAIQFVPAPSANDIAANFIENVENYYFAIGEESTISVDFENVGTISQANVPVILNIYDETRGDRIDSVAAVISTIGVGEVVSVDFDWTPGAEASGKKVKFEAVSQLATDAKNNNNTSGKSNLTNFIAPAFDMEITGLEIVEAMLGNDVIISTTVRNYGTGAYDGRDGNLIISILEDQNEIENIQLPINPMATMEEVVVDYNWEHETAGDYSVFVSIDWNDDSILANNDVTGDFRILSINALDFAQDFTTFDAWADEWTVVNHGSGDNTWSFDSEAQCLKPESYETREEWLITPPIHLNETRSNPDILEFDWYYGSASTEFDFEVYVSSTTNEVEAFTQKIWDAGEWLPTPEVFRKELVQLTTFNDGAIYIGFKFTDTGWDNSLHLDNIGVYASSDTDCGITKIILPTGIGVEQENTVQAEVANYGIASQNFIVELHPQDYNARFSVLSDEVTVAPGETALATFTWYPENLGMDSLYVTIPTRNNDDNDMLDIWAFKGRFGTCLSESFENAFPPEGWVATKEFSTPLWSQVTSSGLESDIYGTKALRFDYAINSFSASLESPLFAVNSPPLSLPKLNFTWKNLASNEDSEMKIYVSTNNGETYEEFYTFAINTTEWTSTILDFSQFIGEQQVKIKLEGMKLNNYFYIDNIFVSDPPPNDLAVETITPGYLVKNDNRENNSSVSVTVKNYGSNIQDNFDVTLTLVGTDGATVLEVTERYSGYAINFGGTGDINFALSIPNDVDVVGFKAEVILASDEVPGNNILDESSTLFEVFNVLTVGTAKIEEHTSFLNNLDGNRHYYIYVPAGEYYFTAIESVEKGQPGVVITNTSRAESPEVIQVSSVNGRIGKKSESRKINPANRDGELYEIASNSSLALYKVAFDGGYYDFAFDSYTSNADEFIFMFVPVAHESILSINSYQGTLTSAVDSTSNYFDLIAVDNPEGYDYKATIAEQGLIWSASTFADGIGTVTQSEETTPSESVEVDGVNPVMLVTGASESFASLSYTLTTFTPPHAYVAPSVYDYGLVTVNTSVTQEFALHNLAGVDMSYSYELGTEDDNFSIVARRDIAAGDSVIMEVMFHPVSIGAKSNELVIMSSDPDDSLITVPLTGAGNIGTIADMEVAEDAADFVLADLDDVFFDFVDSVEANSNDVNVTVTINENNEAVVSLADNWYGSAELSFVSSHDAEVYETSATVTVTAVNDAPELVLENIPAAVEAHTLYPEVTVFSEIDLNDWVTDLETAGTEMSWAVSGASYLDFAISGENILTVSVVLEDWLGNETVSFTATDGGALGDDALSVMTGEIVFSVVNDSPVFSIEDIPVIAEGEEFPLFDVSSWVSDTETDYAGLVLEMEHTVVEGGMMIEWSHPLTNLIITLPDENWYGRDSVRFVASDGLADQVVSEWVYFEVLNINDAPVFVTAPEEYVLVTQPWSYTFAAEDVDNAELTYRVTSMPEEASYDSGSRTLSFIAPQAADTFHFEIQVDDNMGMDNSIVSQPFSVVITEDSEPPVLSAELIDATVDEDMTLEYGDMDDYFSENTSIMLFEVTYDEAKIAEATVDAAHMLTIVPVADANGETEVTVTLRDGAGYSVSDAFDLMINPVNDGPYVAAAYADAVINEDEETALVVAFGAVFGDIDSQELTYGAQALDSNIEIKEVTEQAVTVLGAEDYFGATSIRLSCTDGEYTVYDTVAITIENVQDAPRFVESSIEILEESVDNATLEMTALFYDVDNQGDVINDELSYEITAIGDNLFAELVEGVLILDAITLDYFGESSVSITATDDHQGSVTAVIPVEILNVNDAPAVVSDIVPDQEWIFEEAWWSYEVLVDDVDDTEFGYDAQLSVAGTVEWDANMLRILLPEANTAETVTVTITVNDMGDPVLSDTQEMVLNVYGYQSPSAPVSDVELDEDFGTEDMANLDEVFSGFDEAQETYSFELNPVGIITGEIDGLNHFVITSVANAFGVVTVTLKVDNGVNLASVDEFTVTVASVNDIPVVEAHGAVALDEDFVSHAIDLGPVFDDVETADSLLIFELGGDYAGLFEAEVVEGVLELTSIDNANGSAYVLVYATDADEAMVCDSIVVEVAPVNDAPVLEVVLADPELVEQTEEYVLTYGDLGVNFMDVETADSNLIFTAGPVVRSGALGFAVNGDNELLITIPAYYNGTDEIEVSCEDEGGLIATSTFMLEIAAVNQAPVATDVEPVRQAFYAFDMWHPDNQNVVVTDYTVVGMFSDIDLTHGQAAEELFYSIVSYDESAFTVTINANNEIAITLFNEVIDSSEVVFRAQDLAGTFALDTVLIVVEPNPAELNGALIPQEVVTTASGEGSGTVSTSVTFQNIGNERDELTFGFSSGGRAFIGAGRNSEGPADEFYHSSDYLMMVGQSGERASAEPVEGGFASTGSAPWDMSFYNDDLYWVDVQANKLYVHGSEDANYSFPGGLGTMVKPAGLGFRNDTLWVSDWHNGAIKAFVLSGGNLVYKESLTPMRAEPSGLAFDQNGNLWELDFTTKKIYLRDMRSAGGTTILSEIDLASIIPDCSTFEGLDFAVSAQGNGILYVGGGDSGKIYKIEPSVYNVNLTTDRVLYGIAAPHTGYITGVARASGNDAQEVLWSANISRRLIEPETVTVDWFNVYYNGDPIEDGSVAYLDPLATSNLDVEYYPDELPHGQYYATLTVQSTSSTQEVSLALTVGLAPFISIDYTNVEDAQIDAGYSDMSGSILFDNTLGTGALEYNVLNLPDWVAAGDYSGTVGIGATGELVLGYDAEEMGVGTDSALIYIFHNASNMENPVTKMISLNVVSPVPVIALDGAGMNYEVGYPAEDVEATFTMTNSGRADFGYEVSVKNGSEWLVLGETGTLLGFDAAPVDVAIPYTIDVSVIDEAVAATYIDTVVITSGHDSIEDLSYVVSFGYSVQDIMVDADETIESENVQENSAPSVEVVVENTGTQTLGSIAYERSGTFFQVAGMPEELAAGASAVVTVSFPSAHIFSVGERTGSLTITSDDPDEGTLTYNVVLRTVEGLNASFGTVDTVGATDCVVIPVMVEGDLDEPVYSIDIRITVDDCIILADDVLFVDDETILGNDVTFNRLDDHSFALAYASGDAIDVNAQGMCLFKFKAYVAGDDDDGYDYDASLSFDEFMFNSTNAPAVITHDSELYVREGYYRLGDATNDYFVDGLDASKVLRKVVGLDGDWGYRDMLRGDADQDDVITANDAYYILSYNMGGVWPSSSQRFVTVANSSVCSFEEIRTVPGRVIETEIDITASEGIDAADFRVELGSGMEYVGADVTDGLTYAVNAVESGLNFACVSTEKALNDRVVVTLKFKAEEEGVIRIHNSHLNGTKLSDKFIKVSMYKLAVNKFAVHQNYPNPFNPETRIEFEVADAGNVKIEVYNVRGQMIRELANREYDNGIHTVVWNGRNDLGEAASSGIYFYRVETGNEVVMRKMIMMK